MSETIFVEKLKQVDDRWAWVPEAIAVDTDGDFTIDELNLNVEVCKMGKLLLKYGDLAAELRAELERKEENLKYTAAKISAAQRARAIETRTKVTEVELKELTITDDLYREALNPLHVLRASAVRADHWWRAINTKAKMIEALAFRQSAELRRGYS